MKRATLASGILTAWLLTLGVAMASPPSRPVGSEFPRATRGERALAAAKAARGQHNFQAEGASLINAFLAADTGDKEMDDVAVRLAKFAETRDTLRDQLLDKCDREQLARLADRCKTDKDYQKAVLFGTEFLKRFPADEKAPRMKFDMAFAHMLIDADETRALGMWKDLEVAESTESLGRQAAIFREAVEGPHSVAALEAAHWIGTYQHRIVGNPFRGQFSDWRIIEASQRPFFQDFLNHPDIPNVDKAQVLYKVLFSHYMSANYDEVHDLTQEIFGLVGFETPESEKAALMIGLSYRLRHRPEDAIREFDAFLRAFPNSKEAANVTIYTARSYQERADFSNALIYYRLTFELYPGTEVATEAKRTYDMLMDHDETGDWLAEVERRKPDVLAALRKPLDPKTAWGPDKTRLKLASSDKKTPPPTPATDPRFTRLDTILAAK